MATRATSRPSTASASFLRRWRPFLALALVGVVGLGFTVAYQLATSPSELPQPWPVLTALSVLQPLVLLVLFTALGTWLSPRVGLLSLVHRRAVDGDPVLPTLREQAPLAVGLGLGTGLALVVLDVAFAAAGVTVGTGSGTEVARLTVAFVLATAPLRFLYGGIAEELLVRWGVMGPLAFLGARLSGHDRLAAPVAWGSILLAALVFGLGHLPALAASTALTPAVVARTVALNAVGGIVYGWLFWRRSLEAAMVAHASTHVVLLGLNLVATLVGPLP